MRRIYKALRAIGHILRRPRLLNRVLEDDALWWAYLHRSHDGKAGFPLLDLQTLFPKLDESLFPYGFLDGGSLPTDLALLTALTKSIEQCAYFEIGTWRGESVANVARYAAEAYTLNLSKAQMIGRGWGEKYAGLHGFFSQGTDNIHHLEGDSMQFNFAALDKKFDLIFIDGNHRYDYVKHDTQQVFRHLMHDRSIVVWHDYGYAPEHLRPEVIAGILDGVPEREHRHLYHISNTMSALFTRAQYPTAALDAPSTPNKAFRVRVQLQPWSR